MLQDDASLAPFTGIWAFVGTNADGLAVGQEINVTAAERTRTSTSPQLTDLTFTVGGTPGYPYKVVPTSVWSPRPPPSSTRASMLRFENVTITDINADGDDTVDGFGEWRFSPRRSDSDEVRADDPPRRSRRRSTCENFALGARAAFMQGA